MQRWDIQALREILKSIQKVEFASFIGLHPFDANVDGRNRSFTLSYYGIEVIHKNNNGILELINTYKISTEDLQTIITEIIKEFPTVRLNSNPLLQDVEKKCDVMPDELIRFAYDNLEITKSKIYRDVIDWKISPAIWTKMGCPVFHCTLYDLNGDEMDNLVLCKEDFGVHFEFMCGKMSTVTLEEAGRFLAVEKFAEKYGGLEEIENAQKNHIEQKGER